MLLSTFQTSLAALITAIALTGCATPDPNAGPKLVRQGTIEQITPTQLQSSHHAGVGAVVGGLGGLGIGSLIGNGSGRDVAQVIGTVGGAIVGNEVQKRYDTPVPAQQVIVRMSSGVLVSITQPVVAGLRVGQAVYVEGNGEAARVVAQ